MENNWNWYITLKDVAILCMRGSGYSALIKQGEKMKRWAQITKSNRELCETIKFCVKKTTCKSYVHKDYVFLVHCVYVDKEHRQLCFLFFVFLILKLPVFYCI